MDGKFALAFLAAAIPAFFTPGPNNLMLMASSARFGLRRTVPHALGVCVGFATMVFILGAGLGEVFTQYPLVRTVLRYVAAASLLWMAWTLLGLKVGSAEGRERPLRFFEAAIFQWINPKGVTMGLAFVALLVEPGEGRFLSLFVLALACLALSPFSTGLWMVFGVQLHGLLKRSEAERFLGPIMAALMLVAVVLLLL